MKTLHTFHLFEPLNGLYADVETLFGLLLFGRIAHSLYHLIRHVHPRDPVLHVFGHACGFKGGDTGQDVDFLVEAPITGLFHPEFKFIQVVYTLGLYKFGPSRYFFGKPGNPDFKGIGKGIGRRTHKHLGRSLNIITSQEFAFIPHAPHRLDELH